MKKFLVVFLVVILSALYLANLVPGTTKYSYGGEITLIPIPGAFGYGIGAYYNEGLSLYYYKPYKLNIDGFFGPSVMYGGLISAININDLEIRLNGSLVLYSDNFSFEIFNTKIYPALELSAYVGYYIIGADYSTNSKISYNFFDPQIIIYTKRIEKGKLNFSWYFWPFPIVVGFSVWNF